MSYQHVSTEKQPARKCANVLLIFIFLYESSCLLSVFPCSCVCLRPVHNRHLCQRMSAGHRMSGPSLPVRLPAQLHCPRLPGHTALCQPIRCLHWWPWWHHKSQEDLSIQRGRAESVYSCLPGSEWLCFMWQTVRCWKCARVHAWTHHSVGSSLCLRNKVTVLCRCTSLPVSVPEEAAWLARFSASHWSVWLCWQASTEWPSIETTGVTSLLDKPSGELSPSFWSGFMHVVVCGNMHVHEPNDF